LRRRLIAALAVLAILMAAGAGLWRISKAPCWQLVGEVTCRVETSEKIVALSFDDGPTPEGVEAVLPVLDAYGAKATFFLIGKHMQHYSGQAERLLAAGHELGNHSWSHVRNVGHWQSFYRKEIARTDTLLRQAGAKPTLFRPPFGKRLIGLPLEVERAGYRMLTWDIADQPEHFSDPASFAQDILKRVKPGSIILIHPMYRGNQTARDALPLVLEGLKQRGYRVVTVSQLLALEGE
jgi:peptidoglycan/xylan/chitin deacetylase (PgdA/CDA1 family)